MDARIISAIAIGNIQLAKEAIAATEVKDLNRVFKVFGVKPYTILDATIEEGKDNNGGNNNAGKKAAIKEIILELRSSGAKTYKELTAVKNGRPPFAVSRKRGRNERGIAISRKNARKNNHNVNNNFRVGNKNIWYEGI